MRLLLLFLFGLSPYLLGAQSAFAESREDFLLRPVFKDEFRVDSRKDYRLQGDVAWRASALTASPDASIERRHAGGCWAKFTCGIEAQSLREDSRPSKFRVWFFLAGATNCFVEVETGVTHGSRKQTGIRLFDISADENAPKQRLVREVFVNDLKSDEMSFAYRFGVVEVHGGESRLLSAYISNAFAEVAGVRLENHGAPLPLRSFSYAASAAPPSPTAETAKKVRESLEANREFHRLYAEQDFPKALQFAQRSLELSKPVYGVWHPQHATNLNNVAVVHVGMGQTEQAERLSLQALEIQTAALGKLHPERAMTLNNLATMYANAERLASAEPLIKESVEVYAGSYGVDHPYYARAINNLADLHQRKGEYTRSLPLTRQASEIFKKSLGEKHPLYAVSLNNLGAIYLTVGEYRLAEATLRRSLAIRRDASGEKHPDIATNLGVLAAVYSKMGQHSRAAKLNRQALEIFRGTLGESHPRFGIALNNLAADYKELGDFARAEPLYLQARDVAKSVWGTQHPSYSAALFNLAVMYDDMGQSDRAEPLILEALQIDKEVSGERHPTYAVTLSAAAALFAQMNQFERADSLYAEAAGIRESASGKQHPSYAVTLNNWAVLIAQLGDVERAEALHNQALQIRKSVLGPQHPDCSASLNNLASLFASRGEFPRAKSVALEAHAVQTAAAEKTLPTLSEAQARAWYRRNGPKTSTVLSVLSRCDEQDAHEAYRAVWRTKGMVSRLRVGQATVAGASPEASEAFDQLRDARLKLARIVSAKPAPSQSAGYLKALASANDRKEQLERQLATLNPASKRELTVRDAQIEDLIRQLPADVAVIDFVRRLDWEHVDVSIEFSSKDGVKTRKVRKNQAEPVYDAFVIRSHSNAGDEQIRWIELGPAAPIDSAVKNWRAQLGNTSPGENASQDDDNEDKPENDPPLVLRSLIWEKVEPSLAGCNTVIVLPDGLLNRLPWSVLPGRRPGSFLLEDYALGTAGFGQQLFGLLTAEPVREQNQLLLAGGIRYDQPAGSSTNDQTLEAKDSAESNGENRQWQFLPGTQQETEALSQLWKDRGKLAKLTGAAANETAVAKLLPESRFAHLSTHGFFESSNQVYQANLRRQSAFGIAASSRMRGSAIGGRNPLLMTGVVLAGANLQPPLDELGLPLASDGILTAEEILGLDLRETDLVTLSACETGLGDTLSGEGVFGLQRVLHQAGARTVVASLWKVDDLATRMLMTRFYDNHWNKGQGKLEALRNAQLHMLNHPNLPDGRSLRGLTLEPRSAAPKTRRSHPRHWAAFQLSGDWR